MSFVKKKPENARYLHASILLFNVDAGFGSGESTPSNGVRSTNRRPSHSIDPDPIAGKRNEVRTCGINSCVRRQWASNKGKSHGD